MERRPYAPLAEQHPFAPCHRADASFWWRYTFGYILLDVPPHTRIPWVSELPGQKIQDAVAKAIEFARSLVELGCTPEAVRRMVDEHVNSLGANEEERRETCRRRAEIRNAVTEDDEPSRETDEESRRLTQQLYQQRRGSLGATTRSSGQGD